MTNVNHRFKFDTTTEFAITGLYATGFQLVGTTTYRGHVQELHFFNEAGVQIEFNFRHMPEDKRPVRREV